MRSNNRLLLEWSSKSPRSRLLDLPQSDLRVSRQRRERAAKEGAKESAKEGRKEGGAEGARETERNNSSAIRER